MADIGVRPARKADVREVAGVLARAFYDDPVMMWMLPEDKARTKALPRMFATLTRHHFLSRGASEVASRGGDFGAATLWDPPGQRKSSRWEQLVMMPAMMWAFRSRSQASQTVMEVMEENHPEEPHWYLMVIGSDPSVRGAGFGQALMRSRLDRCDAEHAPAYLEATKSDLVPYYGRFGFEVTGEIKIPDGGPTMWAMWRDPR
ncbi:MAG: GNAT family N-acetyltransferase [Mycobacterium sp.]